ncbi:unnamed protein product, partial [Didymodactylos carnosus]
YVVSSGARRSHGVQGFRVIVQSSVTLEHVNLRIETFLDSVKNMLVSMPDDIYVKQRESFTIKKVEIPKKMHNQGNKWWNEITTHQYCFERPRLEVDVIKSLEREDILKFYEHYISPHSLYRRKLSLHVVPSPIAKQQSSTTIEKDDNMLGVDAGSDDEEIDDGVKGERLVEVEFTPQSVQELTKQKPIADIPLVEEIVEIEKALSKALSVAEPDSKVIQENMVKEEKPLALPQVCETDTY